MAMIIFCALSGFGFSRLMSAVQCTICSPVYAALAFLIVKPQDSSVALFVLCILVFQTGYFLAFAPIAATVSRRLRRADVAPQL